MNRLTASIWGRPKKGKSYFPLTFPGPIDWIEIGESGSEHLVGLFPDKDIRVHRLSIRALTPQLGHYQKLLNAFEEVYFKAIDPESDTRTLIIDSASPLWKAVRTVKVAEQEMIAKADLGRKTNKKMLTDYELANIYFEQIVNMALAKPNLNLILTHRDRETWEKDDDGQLHASGKFEPREFKDVQFLVQVTIHAGSAQVTNPKTGEREEVPCHEIELCAPKKSLEGRRVNYLDYEKLMKLIGGE